MTLSEEQVYVTFSMPGCLALSYEATGIFEVSPLFVTRDTGCWNELETTNFIDDTVRLNPAIGEKEQSYTTALALSRQQNNRQQKIIIIGDADCISNGEISISRPGLNAANYFLIMGAFHWMSDAEVPIDVRRPTPPDNKIYTNGAGVKKMSWFIMGAFPLTLLIIYLLIWIRRRGR